MINLPLDLIFDSGRNFEIKNPQTTIKVVYRNWFEGLLASLWTILVFRTCFPLNHFFHYESVDCLNF